MGGFVSGPDNLSQDGNCWIFSNSYALEYSRVEDDATVTVNSIVSGHAIISGDARVIDRSCVTDYAKVIDGGTVMVNSKAMDYAIVSGEATIDDNSKILCDSMVTDSSFVMKSILFGKTIVKGNSFVVDACMTGNHQLNDTFIKAGGNIVRTDEDIERYTLTKSVRIAL